MIDFIDFKIVIYLIGSLILVLFKNLFVYTQLLIIQSENCVHVCNLYLGQDKEQKVPSYTFPVILNHL